MTNHNHDNNDTPDIEPGERLDAHLKSVRHESAERSLDREDLLDDPLEQFEVWYREAVEHEQVPYPNAVQLATASVDGVPSVRTVLVRDAEDHGFVFFTNYQSQKGRDLAENPQAAMCFMWQVMERQIIVRGTVEKVTPEESDEYFHHRPYGSRIGALASHQSQPVDSKAELESRAAALAIEHPESGDVPRPGHWGGYRLIPTEVEFWQGRGSRMHDRYLYVVTAGTNWTITRLQP